jgi:phage baseplate assembly protein W
VNINNNVAIKIGKLEKIVERYSRKEYAYKDLHLDFAKSGNFDSVLQKRINENDIEVDYDSNAIKNSLRNLFTTRPGQRFLFPEYGLSLDRYLFEAITDENAQTIGETIVRSVELYEPRVTMEKCTVIPKPDDNEYDITIIIGIPLFNTTATINSLLNTKTQTFVFPETSKYK